MIVKMGYMLQKEERRMGGGNVSQDQTSIICIDLKSFYASVECVERGLDPFKANLVVADPTRSKSTICLAITPAMKALGIKNRCRIHEIPDCVKYITAMPRMQLYIGEVQHVTMVDEEKPAEKTPEGGKSVSDSPKTGDNTNLWLWFMLLGIGATGTGALAFMRKKKH